MAEFGNLGEDINIFREDIPKIYDKNVLKRTFNKLLSNYYEEADIGLQDGYGVDFGDVRRPGDLNAMGDFGCDLLFGTNNKSLPKTILELKDWGCLPLTEIQMASTAILKTGLDQISWEPLFGILEDLALTGTVSQSKVHDCATDIITRLLGSDMVPQVLMQYHPNQAASEVIMIESLILCYIKDLINKRRDDSDKMPDGRTTFSSNILTDTKNSRKKPSEIREKKLGQPSYQKTTESFKRKQRSKRIINADLRVPMKRSINKFATRDDTSKVLNLKKTIKAKAYSNNQRNSLIESIIIDSIRTNANIVNNANFINRSKHNEHFGKGDDSKRIIWSDMNGGEERKKTRLMVNKCKNDEVTDDLSFITSEHCRARKRKKSARDWDEIEMETAVDTYYAERDLPVKKRANDLPITDNANQGKFPTTSCLELTVIGNKKFEEHLKVDKGTEIGNTFENISTDKSQCEVCKNFAKRNCSCASFNSSDSSNTLVEVPIDSDPPARDKVGSSGDVAEGTHVMNPKQLEKSVSEDKASPPDIDDTNRVNQSETKVVSKNERPIQESKNFFKPIMKDTSSIFTDTSETSSESIHSENIPSPQYPPILQSVMANRNLLSTNINGDHVIALRISEELMNILKEKFIMSNHYSNVSMKYSNSIEPSQENVNLQIEQMRNYNGKILMRLNVISTLTVMALLSSVLTASAFYFSSVSYVKESTLDVLKDYANWIFNGWCR